MQLVYSGGTLESKSTCLSLRAHRTTSSLLPHSVPESLLTKKLTHHLSQSYRIT